nr:beta-galactosidase [Hymenobacter rubidus]
MLLAWCSPGAAPPTHSFALGAEPFLLDGRPFQMISGELHHPRIPREAWRARLKMARAMGLNTVGTYVCWNAHEPQPGQYDFTGNHDGPILHPDGAGRKRIRLVRQRQAVPGTQQKAV